jgi:hypothetical protein
MGKILHIGAAMSSALQAPTRPASTGLTVRPAVGLVRYSADLVPAGLAPAVESAALLLCNTEARPVKQLATADLIDDLLEPVALVPFLLGHSQTLLGGDDLLAMATAVAEMVQRDFPGLTLAELCAAMRRGCSGEWRKPDERLLASLPTIRSWCAAYSQGSRAQALRALQRADEHRQLLSLPVPDVQADYPARVAELVATARAAGRQPVPEPRGGQRPGPGAYQLPAKYDDGGLLFRWLRHIGAISPYYGGQFRIMVKEGLLIGRELPRTPSHRSFAQLLRTGAVPGSHPLAAHWRTNCQKRQLRQWLLHHAAAGTDLLPWLQQLALLSRKND